VRSFDDPAPWGATFALFYDLFPALFDVRLILALHNSVLGWLPLVAGISTQVLRLFCRRFGAFDDDLIQRRLEQFDVMYVRAAGDER
jgi:hypothetical protein